MNEPRTKNPAAVALEWAQSDRAMLLSALQNISEMAETGRLSVNDCVTKITQSDVDAAAAVTRGWFLTIDRYAQAMRDRIIPHLTDKSKL